MPAWWSRWTNSWQVPQWLDEMPYTETQKVQKTKLRLEGISAPDVWDHEAADYKVKREVIE